MAKNSRKVEEAHCNTCGGETNHFLVAERCTERGGGRGEPRYDVTFQMLECCGCSGVTFRRRIREEGSGYQDPETGEWVWSDDFRYFPPAVSRPTPVWSDRIPEDMRALLKEVYAALYADSRRLAMMGARTLIDMVILDKVGDKGTFGQKLDGLVDQGSVSTLNREFLEVALEAGSAAVHRGHLPSTTEVNHVMDIIENLLQGVYVLEDAAKKLKKSTPSRPKP